jgi:HSP20 family protein
MPRRKGLREDLERVRAHVDALFEDALVESGYGGRGERPPGTWSPPVDLLETEDAFLLYAELPGVEREAIELHADGSRLILSGERQPPTDASGFVRMERSYGAFRRVFELALPVDAEAITARFERGILEVRVPKSRTGRAIPVKEDR